MFQRFIISNIFEQILRKPHLIKNFNKYSLFSTQVGNYSTESMDLKKLVKRLNEYADAGLACDWDNVGLLVEPSDPLLVKKVLVTNDLTEPVLEEALKINANLIVSYHPPIFRPLKRLRQSDWKERLIVKCIENRIAVFSPHTTWDSIDGGINDWLINSFDPVSVEPVTTIPWQTNPAGFAKSIKLNLATSSNKTKFLDDISKLQNLKFVAEKSLENPSDQIEIEFVASANGIVDLIELVKKHFDTTVLSTLRVFDLTKPNLKNVGLARIGTLKEAKTIRDVVFKVKQTCDLKHVRLALGNGKTLDDKVKKIAVGAGSGSKLLNGLDVDLILSGEFQHHETLHEVHRGVSVILTDHTNTERGFFNKFKTDFSALLDKNGEQKPEIIISSVNRDPLEVV